MTHLQQIVYITRHGEREENITIPSGQLLYPALDSDENGQYKIERVGKAKGAGGGGKAVEEGKLGVYLANVGVSTEVRAVRFCAVGRGKHRCPSISGHAMLDCVCGPSLSGLLIRAPQHLSTLCCAFPNELSRPYSDLTHLPTPHRPTPSHTRSRPLTMTRCLGLCARRTWRHLTCTCESRGRWGGGCSGC